MREVVLKNRKLNVAKLLSFGFRETDDGYVYRADFVDGQMTLTVTIDRKGTIHTEVIDSNGDEYVLYRVAGATGSFVGQVKAEYEAMLDEIAGRCFDPDVFKSRQAKEIIAYVRDKYADELEYLWKKFPDNAVVRRSDNKKWYAAILTVSRRKLGFDSDESVEILDLRMRPEDMQTTVDGKTYLPGYHMNKTHWITICLDQTVSTEEIFARIDNSYDLAKK